jgi:ribosomal protein L35
MPKMKPHTGMGKRDKKPGSGRLTEHGLARVGHG